MTGRARKASVASIVRIVAVAALTAFFSSYAPEATTVDGDAIVKAITEPAKPIEERLANAFKEQCELSCMDAAMKLQDPELTVFKRGDKLAELAPCLDRLRATIVQHKMKSHTRAADAVEHTDALLAEARLWHASETENNAGDRNFLNLSWGAGFGFSYALDDVIESAEIVNGKVRVTEDRTQQPRLVLEFHRYYVHGDESPVRFGQGPFVAVAAAEKDVLSGVGLGWMFGWRTREDQKGAGFSVGVGFILDADVKSLGKDFETNEPPPPGETSVRYEKKARWSALLFFTRTF